MRNSQHHRRRATGHRAKLLAGLVAAAAVAVGGIALAGTAQAASVGAAYTRASDWTTGYTGQYEITNSSASTLSGWTLQFDLPSGTTLSSLWNGTYTASGRHITVKAESWNSEIAAGESVTVGFVAASSGTAADPVNCLVNDVKCSVDSTPSPTPTATATATATATPTSGTGTTAAFAPYVDTSLYPAFDLIAHSAATGVKQYNLAFVVDGGGCTPKWGGVTDLSSDAVAAQIGALRAAGGDVRVSFGGAAGSELATTCSSVSALAAAYGKVIDAYGLTKVDFDVEGAASADTAANTRRAKAVAQLQAAHPGLDVSFTLPVMPTGLTTDGTGLLADAKANGVSVSAVDVMAMDYGPSFGGDMGDYAIAAATATQAQVKSVLGLSSDAAAWRTVAVTPMIGVNDVSSEVFTVSDATQLAAFARSKGLGWLSMWSATRDKQCPGGTKPSADATCSSIVQSANAFAKAFAAGG